MTKTLKQQYDEAMDWLMKDFEVTIKDWLLYLANYASTKGVEKTYKETAKAILELFKQNQIADIKSEIEVLRLEAVRCPIKKNHLKECPYVITFANYLFHLQKKLKVAEKELKELK